MWERSTSPGYRAGLGQSRHHAILPLFHDDILAKSLPDFFGLASQAKTFLGPAQQLRHDPSQRGDIFNRHQSTVDAIHYDVGRPRRAIRADYGRAHFHSFQNYIGKSFESRGLDDEAGAGHP